MFVVSVLSLPYGRLQKLLNKLHYWTLEIIIQEILLLMPGSYLKYKVSLSKIVNDILKLDQLQWLLDRSDSHQFYNLDTELDIRQITRRFHGALATGVASQHMVPPLPPILWACICSNCWDQFSQIRCDFSDYSLRISIANFSILPFKRTEYTEVMASTVTE